MRTTARAEDLFAEPDPSPITNLYTVGDRVEEGRIPLFAVKLECRVKARGSAPRAAVNPGSLRNSIRDIRTQEILLLALAQYSEVCI